MARPKMRDNWWRELATVRIGKKPKGWDDLVQANIEASRVASEAWGAFKTLSDAKWRGEPTDQADIDAAYARHLVAREAYENSCLALQAAAGKPAEPDLPF